MQSPDRSGSCVATDDAVRYYGLIHKQAMLANPPLRRGAEDCLMRIAQAVAREYDSTECSGEALDEFANLAIVRC
jgi:hypothetical protein